jgi:hypothetical protein
MTTDLHAAIMNLPNQSEYYPDFSEEWHAGFAEGHRDARHAAAELVSASSSTAEEDRRDAERYRWLRTRDVTAEGVGFVSYIPELGHDGSRLDAAIDAARSALKENNE